MKTISAAANFFMHFGDWVQKRADYILVILAILYSLPCLGYPFGRDQAAHFYIGREWLNGLLPFKDTYDQKPPGIYLIHALGIAVFGAHQWVIRALDLVGMLSIGLLAAKTVRRAWKPAYGEAGILVLLTAGFYYTCFDYWDTAQVETWEGLALLAGYALVEKKPCSWRAFISGALAGIAFLFKLPAAVIAVAVALVMMLRTWEIDGDRWIRRAISSLALYSAGVLMVIGGCVAYFAVQGGFKDMWDVLYGFNLYYATQKPTSSNVAQQWVFDFWLKHSAPWVWITFISWLAGTAYAIARRSFAVARGACLGFLLFLSAVASVWLQRKFYCYHWGITLPFIMLCAGYGVAVCMRYFPRLTIALAITIMIYGFVCSPRWYSNDKITYQTVTKSFWEYTGGYLDRVSYLNQFLGGYGYYYQAEEIIGDMIRQRAQPGDQLIVRGFEPAIYAVSGLRSPSRFFIEIPFIDPFLRGYNTTTWPAEHERACWTNPPRFVVTFARDRRDVNNIISRGYRKIRTVNQFVLLERIK
jgi:hypothetical protein